MKLEDTTPSQEQELHDGLIQEELELLEIPFDPVYELFLSGGEWTEEERQKEDKEKQRILRQIAFDVWFEFSSCSPEDYAKFQLAFDAGIFWEELQHTVFQDG